PVLVPGDGRPCPVRGGRRQALSIQLRGGGGRKRVRGPSRGPALPNHLELPRPRWRRCLPIRTQLAIRPQVLPPAIRRAAQDDDREVPPIIDLDQDLVA